jgi:hypothetical protein
MKLFLLELKARPAAMYDITQCVVVRAQTPKRARVLAATKAGDESKEWWMDRTKTSCRRIKEWGPEGIIITDFYGV